jgi:menaquinol-cytochrome c reductase iron-sulfur subunit
VDDAMNKKNQSQTPERRDFLKKALAVAIGAITSLFPFLASLTVILDPLRRRAESGDFVRVASLGALSEDGSPRKFTVVADRIDAWNKFPQTAIGAVYLRRTGDTKVEALNVVCPHAGCFVDFIAARRGYFCPCHNSTFGLDGKISDPRSPSPRAMDSLPVEIRNGSEVWVRFQNFEAGKKEKIPVA